MSQISSPLIKNLQPSQLKDAAASTFARSLAVSLLLTTLPLLLGNSGLAALLCFGIAIVTALVLIVRTVTQWRKQRTLSLLTLAAYSLFAALLPTNYALVRDHVRWLCLSSIYKNRVFAQPVPANGQLRHTEWDGWGFAGEAT